MPVIRCPHCDTSVEIHADDVGYKVLCPDCHSAFQAGEGERPAPEPSVSAPDPVPTPAPEPRAVIARCTACDREVEIGVEDLGHTMECPHCGEKFRTREETRPDSRRPTPPTDYQPRSRRDDDGEDDDDYEDRPRRRRRYGADDKAYILESARAAIAWPANGLMWTGAIMFVLYLLISTGLGIAGTLQQDSPNAQERQDGVVLILIGVVVMVFGGSQGAVMAVAGFKMKKLRSTAWGYAGGGLGIATIVMSHPCLPTTWAAVTFGIWAIVASSKREVQDAIRINRGEGL